MGVGNRDPGIYENYKPNLFRDLELDIFNLDYLISISNVDTFNFLLNPVFCFLFLSPPVSNKRSLIDWRAKFHISRLL